MSRPFVLLIGTILTVAMAIVLWVRRAPAPDPVAPAPSSSAVPATKTVVLPPAVKAEIRRVDFTAMGISLGVPQGCQWQERIRGDHAMARFFDPEGALLIDSSPAYPWLDMETLRRALGGVWKAKGPVVLPGTGRKLAFSGRFWGLVQTKGKRGRTSIFMAGPARIVVFASPTLFQRLHPKALEVLEDVRWLPGPTPEQQVVKRYELAPKIANGPPRPGLDKQILTLAILLRSRAKKPKRGVSVAKHALPMSLRCGMLALQEKRLTHAQALVLRDALKDAAHLSPPRPRRSLPDPFATPAPAPLQPR